VPGIGTILRRVLLDDIQAIARVPRVQAVVSSCRLVTCAKASAGTRCGTSGAQSGHAPRTWAFAAAAVLCLRAPPPAQTSRARVAKKPDQGTALTVLAPPLARAVSDRLTRHVACERAQCFQRSWRGAEEPGASLDQHGMHLRDALDPAASAASLHAKARRGRETLRPALCLARRARSWLRQRESPTVDGGGSSPAPRSPWTTRPVEPDRCRGRSAGTETFLGRSNQAERLLQSSLWRRAHLHTCVVQPQMVCAVIRPSRQHTRPTADDARHPKAENNAKNPLLGVVYLLTTGGLIRVRLGLGFRYGALSLKGVFMYSIGNIHGFWPVVSAVVWFIAACLGLGIAFSTLRLTHVQTKRLFQCRYHKLSNRNE
jgi:hypothetical protein